MRLYEYEAKKLFHSMDIPTPKQYGVVSSAEDLDGLKLGFPLMLKAMVLVGGRGKAGGIKKAKNLEQARSLAQELLALKIKGYQVETLLVEEWVQERGACYIGVTTDPSTFNNVVIVSASGGVDIEQIAKERPGSILKREVPDNETTLPPGIGEELSAELAAGLGDSALIPYLLRVIVELYAAYQKFDAKVCEINPLLLTNKGLMAADAKVVLDDNALYRQTEIFRLLSIGEKRHDVAEPSGNELRAMASGFPYVDLLPEGTEKDPEKLYVGLVPGGAGYGIFSIDEVANVGGKYFDGKVVPVNFMDSGGGPPQGRVADMFHLLMEYPIVDLIITSRFGGISSCDVFIRGLVQCLKERHERKARVLPVHGRMVGTDLPSAHAFLEKAREEMPDILKDLHIVVGNQMIMADVIKEALEKGFQAKGSR
jgi:succinyl-CoA synthetase beta subunit